MKLSDQAIGALMMRILYLSHAKLATLQVPKFRHINLNLLGETYLPAHLPLRL